MKDEIAQYDCFLMRRFGSRSTRKHYINDLNLFVKHTGELPVAHIAAKHVDSFVEDQVQRGLKPATINRRFYLFANHLGSVVTVTDSSGQLQGDLILYEPFGDYRGTPPDETNPDITDRGFTNQKHNNDLELIYYGARYYMPGIGRFLSPDTIVPDYTWPQSLNRYTYSYNNPVKYVDPSGHDPRDWWDPLIGYFTSRGSFDPINGYLQPLLISRNFPENITYGSEKNSCPGPPSSCFGPPVWLMDFENYGEENPIPRAEFEALTDSVAEDLYTHDVTSPGYFSGRSAYDTPLYNAGGRTLPKPEGEWPASQQVCIEGIRCSGRSEVNYFAQGMWSAAAGETLAQANYIAEFWKYAEYGEKPSADVYFWLEYGYKHYQNWEDMNASSGLN